MNFDTRLFMELKNAIGEQLEAQSRQLIDGRCDTFDDYRYRVGRLRGLRDALEIAREMNARIIGIDRHDSK